MKLKNFFLSAIMAVMFFTTASAAVIDIYDGDYNIYNPADTYVVHGWISESIFSFGFGFTDPDEGFYITITAPDGMPGHLEYAFTTGPYATGTFGGSGFLLAGESISGTEYGGADASPDNVKDLWTNLRNLSIPADSPIYFGPGTGTDTEVIQDFGYDPGNGGGSGGGGSGGTGTVPEPQSGALLALGLSILGLGAVIRARKGKG